MKKGDIVVCLKDMIDFKCGEVGIIRTVYSNGNVGLKGTIYNYPMDYFEVFNSNVKEEQSTVEIRLFNHKNGKVLYENLSIKQLDYILKVLDPKGWQ